MEEAQNSSEIKDSTEYFAVRQGHIFVVDVAPEMFERDPEADISYFKQCLHFYARILSQKLAWNKRDWTGLILYNATKTWDQNPEAKNILTLHKFAEVNASILRDIAYIAGRETNREDYYDPSVDVELDRCLDDVLWQACRAFDSIKIAMYLRQVVLLTRRDNPLADDAAERHKIRLRAQTYRDVNVKLQIVGLGKDWKHELFYKDVDALANNVEQEDSKPAKLDDFEIQMKFPARMSGHLKWRICKDIEIPLVVLSICSKTKYLKAARMQKDTNEILDLHKHWRPTEQPDEWSDETQETEENFDTRIPDNVEKAVIRGGRKIFFKPHEIKNIRETVAIGIHLIGFKPIAWSLAYHIEPPKFAGPEFTASDGEKALFAALLKTCVIKNVMAMCAVTHRAATYLARLIPCPEYGGFYLYKMAFSEQVNDLSPYTQEYVYDGVDEESLPTDAAGVDLMTRIAKKIRMKWNPFAFVNPKLTRQLAYIEALALDTEFVEPIDNTCPDTERMAARLGDLRERFETMFDMSAVNVVKRGCSRSRAVENAEKVVKVDSDRVRSLIKNGKLNELNVESLKAYARSIGVQTTGLKAQLIERITQRFVEK